MKPVNTKLQRLIGVRIRRWRTRSNLSQSELARRTKVTPEAISLIEAGDRAPSLAMASALCRSLRRPLYKLFKER